MLIKSPHDSLNQRDGVGRRGPVFEASCWRYAVPLSWWFIWLITMEVIELIHLSSKTWWEEFWTMDDAGISFVSNYSRSIKNTLLSFAEICNNSLEI